MHRWLSACLALLLVAGLTGPAAAKPDKDTLERAIATLERGARSGDFDTRARAVEALGHGPKKQVLPIIEDALTDRQWKVRRAAIEALRELKDRRWEREVATSLADPKVDVDEILAILEPLGPRKGTAVIMAALKDPKLPQPERIASAYARRGGEWMEEGFEQGLKLRAEPGRAAFERALPDLPLPDANDLYDKTLKKQEPAVVLAVLARVEQLPPARTGKMKFLHPLLKSKDGDVAFRAAVVLARSGDPAGKAILVDAAKGEDEGRKMTALEALAPIATSDMYDLVRPIVNDRRATYPALQTAYALFLKAGHPKLQAHLQEKLLSTELAFRRAAVRYLGDVKGRAALEDLHPLLNAGPIEVRIEAARAVGRLGQRDSIPVLRDAMMTAREKELRIAILESLADIGDADIIPVVRFYVSDSDLDVRRAAVLALAAVPHETAVGDLQIVATRERNKEIRELALRSLVDLDPARQYEQFERALGWLPPEYVATLVERKRGEVTRHLRAALGHDRPEIRSTAFAALVHLDEPAQIAELEALATGSKHQELRIAALDRLVELQGKRATTLLGKLAQATDPQVRVRAIEALGRLGDKDSEQLLRDQTEDPSEAIRVAAAAALVRL